MITFFLTQFFLNSRVQLLDRIKSEDIKANILNFKNILYKIM